MTAGTSDYPADFRPVTLIPLSTDTCVDGGEKHLSQKDDPWLVSESIKGKY